MDLFVEDILLLPVPRQCSALCLSKKKSPPVCVLLRICALVCALVCVCVGVCVR
jgi:hypothetical protein